jgi:hypothetical protein
LLALLLIVQDAINENPRFANEIRKRAQDVLGVNPSAAAVALNFQEEQAVAEQKKAAMGDLAKAALDRGVMYVDKNGEFDINATARAGAQIRFAKQEAESYTQGLDNHLKELQVQKAEAGDPKPLTLEERRDAETRFISGYTDKLYLGMMDSAASRILPMMKQNGNLSHPEQEAQLSNNLGQIKTQFFHQVDTWMAETNLQLAQAGKPGLSPQARDTIRNTYEAQFKNWEELVKGPFSNLETNLRQMQQLKTRAGIDFDKSTPDLSYIVNTLGPQAAAPIIQSAIHEGTAANNSLQQQGVAAVGRGSAMRANENADPRSIYSGATAVLEGKQKVSQLPEAHKVPVLKTTIAAVSSFADAPKLDDKGKAALYNGMREIMNAGLTSSDPEDFKSAAATMQGAKYINAINQLAKTDADKAKELGGMMLDLNYQSVSTDARALRPYTQPAVSAYQDAKIGLAPPPVSFTPVYNPDAGRVEIQIKDKQGSDFSTNRGFIQQAPKQMVDAVTRINKSLDTMVQVKDYGSDREKGLNPQQLKQARVLSVGTIPLKPGTQPVTMPAPPKEEPKPAAIRVGGKYGDMIDQVAQDEGVDPMVAHAFAMEESNGSPNPRDAGAGAIGMFQLMPDTARELGVDPNKVSGNIMGGVRYIGKLLNQFDGDIQKAAAAYIAGPAKVDDYLANPDKFPRTKTGVTRILNFLGIKPRQQVSLKVVD